MPNYTQQPNQMDLDYSNVLWTMDLQMGTVYNVGHLERIIIDVVVP